MNKTKITLFTLLLLLIITTSYIIVEKSYEYKTLKETRLNETYALGFNQGVEQWNAAVIYNVNNNQVIPYWFNGSYFELNINQLCQNER